MDSPVLPTPPSHLNEVWKPVILSILRDRVVASNLGRIQRFDTTLQAWIPLTTWEYAGYQVGKLACFNPDGSCELKRLFTHRLVCLAFHGIPTNIGNKLTEIPIDGIPYVVNHKDSNKLNNRPENLEWTDTRANIQHAFDSAVVKTAFHINMTDLTTNGGTTFYSYNDVGRKFNIDSKTAFDIVHKHDTIPWQNRYIFKIERYGVSLVSDKYTNVIVKDYRTNSITLYNSINEACRETKVPVAAVGNRLFKKDRANVKLINGYLFRTLEQDKEEWPVYSESEVKHSIASYALSLADDATGGSNKAVYVKDYRQPDQPVREYAGLKLACEKEKVNYKNVFYAAVTKRKKGSPITMVAGRAFKYLDDPTPWPTFTPFEIECNRICAEEAAKLGRDGLNPIAIFRVKDYVDGTESIVSLVETLSELTGCAKSSPMTSLTRKSGKKVLCNGYYFKNLLSQEPWPEFSKEEIEESAKGRT